MGAGYNIRVKAVSPGPFQSQGARARLWPSETTEQSLLGEIPLGRFGRASEVAEIICVLASRALPWVTVASGWQTAAAVFPWPWQVRAVALQSSGPTERRSTERLTGRT